jgi:hypothetical protein
LIAARLSGREDFHGAPSRRHPGHRRGRLFAPNRADEEGTLAALKALRVDLIDPKLAEYNGRIVKLMGDGMLAEFVERRERRARRRGNTNSGS